MSPTQQSLMVVEPTPSSLTAVTPTPSSATAVTPTPSSATAVEASLIAVAPASLSTATEEIGYMPQEEVTALVASSLEAAELETLVPDLRREQSMVTHAASFGEPTSGRTAVFRVAGLHIQSFSFKSTCVAFPEHLVPNA